MDTRKLARFPYLKETASHIKESDPSLDDFLTDPAYEEARIAGGRRVLEALENSKIEDHSLVSDAEILNELLSYPVARMIVSCVGDPFLIRRYALSEAKTGYERWKAEDDEFITSLSNELDVDHKMEDGYTKIHFSDFLKATAQLRGKIWKLINQRLDDGYVTLNRQRFLRVLQESLRKKIENELPLEVNEKILETFREPTLELLDKIQERKSKYKAEDFGKIRTTRLPPCMHRLLATLQTGEGIPHTGRFALTAFLRHLGLRPDDILRMFSTIPDFDEGKTRYQIEHISGVTSGTKYTPPECSTMKSYGICYDPDELCARIKHPLSYYRLKGKRRS
ncbi:MAG: DNA primase large subunit PriL [Methanobacteriota archaeon]|nr:MAG: DNA primase large subunit PriL [Euryarchaeota archaeon]